MTDIIIVGTGAAGLFCALKIPSDKKVLIITKEEAEKSDSYLAQGGICVLRNSTDYDSYFEDTMKAGHYENDREAVEIMIRSSQEIIRDLMEYGVEFEKRNGRLSYTREGAHSIPRILYHEDVTGMEITGKLIARVRERENIQIREHTTMIDILRDGNKCKGIVVSNEKGDLENISGSCVILASGGIGGLYKNSTNYPHITGDAVAIALKHDIKVKDMHRVQIHPTALYSKKPGRRFLISESVRGEGAYLLNKAGKRFTDELLPRDLLTKEIYNQMKKDGTGFVWLTLRHLSPEKIKKRFPNIYRHCLEEGYDITEESIPVTPAQHYFMGGIQTDMNGLTSMDGLYAIGETSCTGVHGANRLASNSLLESLVFAERAAKHITENFRKTPENEPELNKNGYTDLAKLKKEYAENVLNEVERSEKEHERHYNNEAKCG
ncbi:L-aspartate oxidase [Parasporobacterium paucivorans]|uniref:L-aspartate oxidase n=1 Tax=Parasporobacterium paucivorans DSM 15970 TaxID=1122934 RepID=A0A1M6D4Y3_9FIRM|nr:L-aspartate oxidase [Parasporobacterium paucivorans]SHI68290.1 L-aspartate oxidase [Parasporobacterium paucivorans DSM 15970]